MAALLKLGTVQIRFIDFLACADAKSSRNAKPRSEKILGGVISEERLSLLPLLDRRGFR
jgi:hypothetical protein